MGSSYVGDEILAGLPASQVASRNGLRGFGGALEVSVGLQTQLQKAFANMARPSLLADSESDSVMASASQSLTSDLLVGSVTSDPGPFGPGLLLSDVNGRAFVHAVSAVRQNDVAQSVFASVLNATAVLDVCHSGGESFSFLKEEASSFADDLEELQRLSGSFNISSENIRPHGRQLCAQRLSSSQPQRVCLLYGVDRRLANRHVLRATHKAAARAAWAVEAAHARQGLLSPRAAPWTAAQKRELAKSGGVRGWVAVEAVSAHKVPQLIGQSSNIRFVRDSEVAKWKGKDRS